MVQSLEQYVAEATNAYKPARTAVQTQLDALSGQLDTANQQINKNYAQQQSRLNSQRNMAAEAASMQAAGSGGSFGGATNIANRKYYDQTFVPAQTQLQTNQSNDLAQTRQYYDNQRTNLNSQMSNLDSQANQLALQKYWTDVETEKQRQWEAEQAEIARRAQAEEAEKNRQAQLRAAQESAAASNNYAQYLMDAIKNGAGIDKSQVGFQDWLNKYSGLNDSTKNQWNQKINKVTSNTSLLTRNALQSILDAQLRVSPEYKQYLSWRNS